MTRAGARPRLLGAALLAALAAGASGGELRWTAQERAAILSHGPWPPPAAVDPGNRASGRREAIAFGARLFFDRRLAVDGTLACSSCHDPQAGWAERRPRALGRDELSRNTKSVLDARFNRWFGWSGATDSLWAASLRPLLDPREMGSAERHVAQLVCSAPDLSCGYRLAFGRPPPADDERVFVDIGKALAAYQETLVTGRTPFDAYRDAIARGDREAASRYPIAAQRGLRLFVGEAGCNLCHLGPGFTNREFDKVGIPVRGADGTFDWGRYEGIKALQASRFNLLSRHNDDPTRANSISTRHVALEVEAYGAFAVPTLRNVASTGPYMHDGSISTLRDVVRHYSEIDDVKLHVAAAHPHAEPGETLPPRPAISPLRTLMLAPRQIDDLVAFLETLTPERATPARIPPLAVECVPAAGGGPSGQRPDAPPQDAHRRRTGASPRVVRVPWRAGRRPRSWGRAIVDDHDGERA